jgi:hypothetical protein
MNDSKCLNIHGIYYSLGKPGLSSHLMLNNRRYVLTVDTEGQVAQWDLVEVVY